MANINRNKKSPPKRNEPVPDEKPVTPSAFSLRLPPPLRDAAEAYSEMTGVSLNGLLCVALADYLASRGYRPRGF